RDTTAPGTIHALINQARADVWQRSKRTLTAETGRIDADGLIVPTTGTLGIHRDADPTAKVDAVVPRHRRKLMDDQRVACLAADQRGDAGAKVDVARQGDAHQPRDPARFVEQASPR